MCSTCQTLHKRLYLIRRVAQLDFVLLLALLYCSFTEWRTGVKRLGPLHGINFITLLVLAATGASDGYWRWKFPAFILVSLGPLGAWLGERSIQRQLAIRATEGR